MVQGGQVTLRQRQPLGLTSRFVKAQRDRISTISTPSPNDRRVAVKHRVLYYMVDGSTEAGQAVLDTIEGGDQIELVSCAHEPN